MRPAPRKRKKSRHAPAPNTPLDWSSGIAAPAAVEKCLRDELNRIVHRYPSIITGVIEIDRAIGIPVVKPLSREPDGDRARDIVRRCLKKGLRLPSPTHVENATLTMIPSPASTTASVIEGTLTFEEAVVESLRKNPLWGR